MSENTPKRFNEDFGRKKKFKLPFTETINEKDLVVLKRDQTTEELWMRYEVFKQEILDGVDLSGIEPSVSFMIDYSTSVQTLATWGFGNYENRVSTEANSVDHTGVSKWHFSRLDINNINLDIPKSTVSLWDWVIDSVEGAEVLIKIYNRENKAQYVYLKAIVDTFVKANESLDTPPYYDLEFDAMVIRSSNLETNTIQNPTVAIIIGRQTDVVRNRTDSFASLPKQEYAVTLTAAEYAAMGSGRPETTLYMIPCDGDSEYIVRALPTFESNAEAISGGLTTNTWYKTSAGDIRIVV